MNDGIKIMKFNGTNYRRWAMSIKGILNDEKCSITETDEKTIGVMSRAASAEESEREEKQLKVLAPHFQIRKPERRYKDMHQTESINVGLTNGQPTHQYDHLFRR